MALACQRNAYLRQLESLVESCEPTTENVAGTKINGFNIILEDTILFPDGGGQPDDRGTINDIPVLKVSLQRNKAVHFTTTSVDVGSTVSVIVDWKRRFDHMQQHSAQHLITAVAEAEYGYKTTSWSLGETICKIELNVNGITEEQMNKIEELSNQYIREQRKMYPTYYDSIDDPAVSAVRSRGLPDDLAGPIRVMSIEGLDDNLCCGTHVSNLAHLQVIKILGFEKGKKGSINLLFLAGDRVTAAFGKSISIEKQINSLLTGAPSDFPELIQKLQASFKLANKNSSNLLKELVVFEAQQLSESVNKSESKYLVHHRREGDNEYMNNLIQKLTCSSDVVKFITVGDDKGVGSFLLQGPNDFVSLIAAEVCEIIDGKGAGKGGRYQGKANRLSQKHKVEQLIKSRLGL